MILFLDDERRPWQHGFTGAEWVKTAAHAIEMLRTGTVRFASLDHDLLPEHYPWALEDGQTVWDCRDTGYDVTEFLQQNPEYWPAEGVRVHSKHTAGVARMLPLIQAHYGRLFQTWILDKPNSDRGC